ncbi:acyltransferase [Salinivibrio sp. KP-1]|uniref:acyltransferase n=1 Tax=Salinivibrio sp. KP-1 TaxID=1406902 RepID=UPI000697495F|nr:acyltransferase [Salinivibrio sp. KP-1]
MIKKLIVLVFRFLLGLEKTCDRFYGLACLSRIKNKRDNCFMEGKGVIYNPELISLGYSVSIGKNFFIRAGGKISIGDYTRISRNVTIHTVNHNISGTLLPYDRNDIKKDINIGKFVWIGMNVSILPGVTIGDGAVIGMGAIISKDVEPGDIVVGSVQRVVKKREKRHVDDLVTKSSYLKN